MSQTGSNQKVQTLKHTSWINQRLLFLRLSSQVTEVPASLPRPCECQSEMTWAAAISHTCCASVSPGRLRSTSKSWTGWSPTCNLVRQRQNPQDKLASQMGDLRSAGEGILAEGLLLSCGTSTLYFPLLQNKILCCLALCVIRFFEQDSKTVETPGPDRDDR